MSEDYALREAIEDMIEEGHVSKNRTDPEVRNKDTSDSTRNSVPSKLGTKASSSSGKNLPKIVIEGDNILVVESLKSLSKEEPVNFNDNWVEKNAFYKAQSKHTPNSSESITEEDSDDEFILSEELFSGFINREERGDKIGDLEKGVGGLTGAAEKNGDFYKASGSNQELYDAKKYEEKSYDEGGDNVEYIKTVESAVKEERHGERSMLEVAGFEDKDAEKKREEKKRALLG